MCRICPIKRPLVRKQAGGIKVTVAGAGKLEVPMKTAVDRPKSGATLPIIVVVVLHSLSAHSDTIHVYGPYPDEETALAVCDKLRQSPEVLSWHNHVTIKPCYPLRGPQPDGLRGEPHTILGQGDYEKRLTD